MRLILAMAILSVACIECAAAGMTDSERADLEQWIKARDKSEVHRIVLDIERDPLGAAAEKLRPALLVYFEDVDYVFCLTREIVSLQESEKREWYDPVWLQIIFASGDFVLQHPEQASDRYAYMMAGWQSALRVYEIILNAQPKARHADLDELIELRDQGRLGEYIREHLCDQDSDASSNNSLNLAARPVMAVACATTTPGRTAG